MNEREEVYCDRQLCIDQTYALDGNGGCHMCPAGKETERERLIKEFIELNQKYSMTIELNFIHSIADFILNDRLRILEENEKPLILSKDILVKYNCNKKDLQIIIDTALQAIEKIKGEGK